MNNLAAQLALDDSAMGKEVHEAQEGNGNDEGEEGGEVVVHFSIYLSFSFLLGGSSICSNIENTISAQVLILFPLSADLP